MVYFFLLKGCVRVFGQNGFVFRKRGLLERGLQRRKGLNARVRRALHIFREVGIRNAYYESDTEKEVWIHGRDETRKAVFRRL